MQGNFLCIFSFCYFWFLICTYIDMCSECKIKKIEQVNSQNTRLLLHHIISKLKMIKRQNYLVANEYKLRHSFYSLVLFLWLPIRFIGAQHLSPTRVTHALMGESHIKSLGIQWASNSRPVLSDVKLFITWANSCWSLFFFRLRKIVLKLDGFRIGITFHSHSLHSSSSLPC